jgi:hypothetical protein
LLKRKPADEKTIEALQRVVEGLIQNQGAIIELLKSSSENDSIKHSSDRALSEAVRELGEIVKMHTEMIGLLQVHAIAIQKNAQNERKP